jgi:hypothetical protein
LASNRSLSRLPHLETSHADSPSVFTASISVS